ncbi:MAG: MOSC domain-containing protein [Sandaracinaceae bacterium]
MSVLELAEIWIYPVKSLCGVRVERAEVGELGVEHDRRYMLVDPTGRFVTQREHPSLAAVSAELTADGLVLTTPGGARVSVGRTGEPRRVTIWGDPVEAVDVGADAAALLSDHVASPVRLVYMPSSVRRRADEEHTREGDLVSFADAFSFLVTHQASLDDLNARLDVPVDIRRFRPNLVIAGGAAWAEDGWRELRIGEVTLRSPKPCARCAVVDVDPDRAEPDRRVLGELARFRKVERHVNFGINYAHDGRGALRVGMPVHTS